MERSKKVLNGPVMRLIRTISFVLIFVSSAILSIEILTTINLGFIQNFKILTTLDDFITNELSFMGDYLIFTLLVGFIALLWTQSNSIGKRVVFSVLILVGAVIFDNLFFNQFIIPFLPELTFVNDLLGDLNNTYSWFYLFVLIPILLLFIMFSAKRPKRLSTKVVGNGLMVLILATLVNHLPVLIGNDWATQNWFTIVDGFLHSFSFVLLSLGSAFGIIGMFRK